MFISLIYSLSVFRHVQGGEPASSEPAVNSGLRERWVQPTHHRCWCRQHHGWVKSMPPPPSMSSTRQGPSLLSLSIVS